jgi:hypothetical protein
MQWRGTKKTKETAFSFVGVAVVLGVGSMP